MRNRIAIWGRDAQEKRVLLAIELQVADNIVRIETYPEKDVTDEVYKRFMDQWRKGQEAELPEPDRTIARELSVTEGLLPDDLKAEQTDMILRAQTEWHYHVLSEKLAQTYKSELAEIEDRVERAGEYTSDLWNQAKQFWQKVQSQLEDKTLLREQGNDIRKRVDKTFATLKKMREDLNAKYAVESEKHVGTFNTLLQDLETRIGEGTHLNKVFNELREVQRKFHGVKFTKADRDKVYNRIDAAFKAVKEKRGQGGGGNGAAVGASRNESRLAGLLKAMDRMKSGIGRDQNDLKFEHRRIEKTDGQLEKQIRQAKVVMIESRIASKQTKLDDMEKTKAMLEKKIASDKKRAEKQAKKAAERAAAEAAKAKIAADISNREVSPEEAAKLAAAAEAIQAAKGKKGRKKASERATGPVASMAALSSIVSGEQTELAIESARKAGIEAAGAAAGAKVAAKVEQAEEAATTAEEANQAAEDLGGKILDTVTDHAVGVIEAAGAATEEVRKEGGLLDQAEDLLAAAADAIEDAVEEVTTTVKAVAQVAGEKLAEATDSSEEE